MVCDLSLHKTVIKWGATGPVWRTGGRKITISSPEPISGKQNKSGSWFHPHLMRAGSRITESNRSTSYCLQLAPADLNSGSSIAPERMVQESATAFQLLLRSNPENVTTSPRITGVTPQSPTSTLLPERTKEAHSFWPWILLPRTET